MASSSETHARVYSSDSSVITDDETDVKTLAHHVKIRKLSSNAVLPSKPFLTSNHPPFFVLESSNPLPDLTSYKLSSPDAVTVPAHGNISIPINLGVDYIPEDIYLRIEPLPGNLDTEAGVKVMTHLFRGPIQVTMFNSSDRGFEVKAGQPVACLTIAKYRINT